MADVFDLYVKDNRTIQFKFTEPIMLEDSHVTDWVFHIPRILNNLDVSGWAWWLVYINARGQKYSELLTLSEDPESPLDKCIATYTVDYSMSIRAGVVRFSLEAINTDTGGEILNEWHTQTYQAKVQDTLQGNQVEFAETESDIISALIIEVQNKVAQLTGGATPEPVSLIADMTDTKKVYLYVGSETGESTNYWYYYNGSAWVAGGLYASDITVDSVPTQGSTNAVSSGGVYSALHDTDTTLSQSGQAADAGATGTALAGKVDKVQGKGLSSNDYTDEDAQAVQDASKSIDVVEDAADLYITDNEGNVIAKIASGHVVTKNFNSQSVLQSISGKQNKLTFDNTPTANSTNPVTSGGVKAAIDAIPSGSVNIIKDSEAENADLDISDDYGNVLVRFLDGGIKTKQFDGKKYITFSASGTYTLGQSTTAVINRTFKKGDRIVLHVEREATPWDSGGRVSYYAGNIQITDATWRGDCAYLEYVVPQDVNSVSAVFPTNAYYSNTDFVFKVSLLGDIPIEPTIVTIKKDGSGNYTNLKACLADIGYKANDVLNPYRIEIYPGTYDVLYDYTLEEKADIFYGEISINQYSQTSFVGPKLLNGISLVGMGRPSDVVLTAYLDPTTTDDLSKRQRGQISTLNLQGSGTIENLTIVAKNMRYCVHDDFSAPLGKKCKRIVKNCIFRGYNIAYGPHTTYGAGMPQGGMDFLFEGCDFGEDVGIHTQETLYQRPEIHLINCKGHSFRIGDNETVDPITEYTVYRLDNCNFLDIRHSMADTKPHAKLYGSGGSSPFYQLDLQMEYNTREITIVPLDVLGTALTVGTCVEMYNDNSSGPRFRAITALANFAGIVVFIDEDDNTYIQTRGYVRTDRLGLSSFSLHDYIGLDGTACAVAASAASAFGMIVYIDYSGEGYVKLGGM